MNTQTPVNTKIKVGLIGLGRMGEDCAYYNKTVKHCKQ